MAGLMKKARKCNIAGYSALLVLELVREWAHSNPKEGRGGCVALDQGCPLKRTGQYEWKCSDVYRGNNEEMGIVMAGLQRIKPRSWNSGWGRHTCDASDHDQDLWPWHGSYRAGEGKGWTEELSSLAGKKRKKIAIWVVNYQGSGVREVKLKEIPEEVKRCLFELIFWMWAVRTLIIHPTELWKQFSILTMIFLLFLLSRDANGCLLRDPSGALEHVSQAQCHSLPASQ